MKNIVLLVLLFILYPMLLNAGEMLERTELTIFSAAGAKQAIDEVSEKFESRYGIRVKINYAGGGEALSQMLLSQTGDLYVAPEQSFMERAEKKQVIDSNTVKILGYVVPVIAVKKGNPRHIGGLSDLTRKGIRIARARPETTLTGKFALEIFKKSGFGKEIEKNVTIQTARPDQLLTMLILDQVDAGIIWHCYKTLAPEQIDIIYLSPYEITGVGKMEIGKSLFSKNSNTAQNFIDFAVSAQGKAIFQRHGYMVDPEEVKKYYPDI